MQTIGLRVLVLGSVIARPDLVFDVFWIIEVGAGSPHIRNGRCFLFVAGYSLKKAG